MYTIPNIHWPYPLFWMAISTELCLALIDAANDKQPEVRQMIMTSLHELGKKQPEMVLSAIKGYLVKHQKVLHLSCLSS